MTTPPPLIPLGFEVGTGSRVAVPLKHLAICGQTQEAGKTTALEALIARAPGPVASLAFITKRGEASFRNGRPIEPFFREQADWQFVASILEASRGEKLKFERAWIIRASKGARTLADVQRNVQREMKTAKGLSADVYLTLDAYLSAVVPQIAAVHWAPRLALSPGLNVMDLTPLGVELQHLVLRSALDWVLSWERDTIVVVPEAWKFIPEGRNTPVKLAAEAFIRQAAASRNYLWIDSQDLGGIAKVILRSVALWILGVQREHNEIKRTLANIPANVARPKPAAIATLGLGQFFACWGHVVTRTYVQPVWVADDVAYQIATGVRSVHDAAVQATANEEDTVHADDIKALQAQNDELRRENTDLRARLARLEGDHPERAAGSGSRHPARAVAGREALAVHEPAPAGDDRPAARLRDDLSAVRAPAPLTPADRELYEAFKARLIAEAPAILEVLTLRPELTVRVQRPTISVDGDTLRGRVAQLIAGDFFNEAQTNSTVLNELARRGFTTAMPNLSRELGELTRMGFLTRENKWYRAVPDMRVNIVEAA